MANNQDKILTRLAQIDSNFLLLEEASCCPYVLNRRMQKKKIFVFALRTVLLCTIVVMMNDPVNAALRFAF